VNYVLTLDWKRIILVKRGEREWVKSMVHDLLYGLNAFKKMKKKKIENLGLIIERLTVGIA